MPAISAPTDPAIFDGCGPRHLRRHRPLIGHLRGTELVISVARDRHLRWSGPRIGHLRSRGPRHLRGPRPPDRQSAQHRTRQLRGRGPRHFPRARPPGPATCAAPDPPLRGTRIGHLRGTGPAICAAQPRSARPLPPCPGAAHSAAMRTSGAAARTSASTWLSNGTKFLWNMATRLRAVSSNSALFCQVLCG